jgi:hypothetical protein
MTADTTAGSSMWPDLVPNRDVTGGWKLPKQASPCYLLLTKGDPDNQGLTADESSCFQEFSQKDWARNPCGAPFERADFKQTLPHRWFPTLNARTLLVYYQPWRKQHHDPQIGNYFTWSLHQSVKNAAMVSARDELRADPTAANPVWPIPTQELRLVKQGLDAYWHALMELGVVVDAPFMDDDYLWIGYWNDDAVEKLLGTQVAVMCVVANTGVKGKKQASQCAYYLLSQVRNSVLYPAGGAAVGGPPVGRRWVDNFNRVNVLEKDLRVTWGTGWQELRAPAQFAAWYSGVSDWHGASMEQLRMGVGGIHHMHQRMLHLEVQLSQAEQAPTSNPLPPHHPLTPGPERDQHALVPGPRRCCSQAEQVPSLPQALCLPATPGPEREQLALVLGPSRCTTQNLLVPARLCSPRRPLGRRRPWSAAARRSRPRTSSSACMSWKSSRRSKRCT